MPQHPTKSDPLSATAEAYFLKEMEQAWQHYRHLETTRFSYITLFFTGFFAGVGYALSLVATKGITPNVLAAVAIILAIEFGFAMFLYVVVVRLNTVLNFYSRIIDRSRLYFVGRGNYAWNVWQMHPRQQGLFAVSSSVTFLIEVLMMSLVIGESVAAFFIITFHGRTTPVYQWILATLLGFGMALTLGWATTSARMERDSQDENLSVQEP